MEYYEDIKNDHYENSTVMGKWFLGNIFQRMRMHEDVLLHNYRDYIGVIHHDTAGTWHKVNTRECVWHGR